MDEAALERRLLGRPERQPDYVMPDYGRIHQELRRTYACATPRETMADWLDSTALALEFYGGSRCLIVPDNPRALIADANRYAPRANDTVLDFAPHYSTSFLPARAYHPQDKPKVESAVQVVERWIMARLRHQRSANIHEVNLAIVPRSSSSTSAPFPELSGSRASAFAALDAPALQALPAQRYEIAPFKTVKVHIDYHVDVDKYRYSVPHALVGQALEARITRTAIELLHRGQRIACHARNSRVGGFSTVAKRLVPGIARDGGNASRLRVMLVNDSVDAADMLGMVLSASGHEIAVDYNARNALATAVRFLPDVCISIWACRKSTGTSWPAASPAHRCCAIPSSLP